MSAARKLGLQWDRDAVKRRYVYAYTARKQVPRLTAQVLCCMGLVGRLPAPDTLKGSHVFSLFFSRNLLLWVPL